MSLDDKLVLVTGGTGSIGQALVEAFHAAGAQVVFQYHSSADVAASLQARLGIVGIHLDLGVDFIAPDLAADVLINNAGTNESQVTTHLVDTGAWNRTLAVNLTAPFLLCRAYLPGMVARRWGRIINISSIYGLSANETSLPYNVSKHGLSGLTKTIAREYGAHGITCNEICPGPVDSAMVKRLGSIRAAAEGIGLDEYLESIRAEIPAGRLAMPGEIADLALFLASSAASYLNGVSVPLMVVCSRRCPCPPSTQTTRVAWPAWANGGAWPGGSMVFLAAPYSCRSMTA